MKNGNKHLLVGLVTLALLLGSVGNAAAITHGQLDGNRHAYVGLLTLEVGGETVGFCSGALIAPTVVLTAGHCTAGITGGRIWFDSPVADPFGAAGSTSIEFAAIYPDPAFCGSCGQGLPGFDAQDVGIVILSRPVTNRGFAVLPSPGFVDSLPMKSEVTIVGYGTQALTQGIQPHKWQIDGNRYFAPTQLVQSNDVIQAEFIKLTANPSKGKGGTCFGDSGGPDLVGNIIVGVNSFVNGQCTGVTYSFRVDTADALAFINSFLH
jgi:Trypsin